MLPGETTLTLLKSKKMETNPVGRREVPCRIPRGLRVEAHGDTTCDVFTDFVVWVPHGDLPREAGYDPTLLGLEREHYERWAAAQPSLVDRPVYTTPTDILRRPNDDSGPGLTLRDGRVEEASGTSDADDPSVTVGVGATSEVAGDDSNGDDDGDDVSDTCDALDDTEAAA
ncbi:hypothetical protein PI125_g25068 [Phytophthora idaei]|nr:hypothetical protein PI125_g25068 [Phytophthora idaei]